MVSVEKALLFAILISVVLSCSAPPEKTAQEALPETIHLFLSAGTDAAGLIDTFARFRDLHGTEDLISCFLSEQSIRLSLHNGPAGPDTIVHSIGPNSVRVSRTVWLTSRRNRKLFYSIDKGKNWYALKNSRKKGVINIDYVFPSNSSYNHETGELFVNMSWIADIAENPVPVRMKEKRLVALTEGHVFYSTEGAENTIDLSEIYLEIPEGTELDFFISFTGNLLNSRFDGMAHVIRPFDDLYIYTTDDSDFKLGVSRDGKNWNYNFFAFRYDLTELFRCTDDGRLEYVRVMDLNYDN